MSRQSRFKLKRPHSPDILGLHNYKKQRLIEDFENLNLNDGPRRPRGYANVLPDSLEEIGIIRVPPEVQKHARKLRSSENYTDERLLYDKLRETIRHEAMKIVLWCDPLQVAYMQWLEWMRTRWAAWPIQDALNEYDSDVDMDT